MVNEELKDLIQLYFTEGPVEFRNRLMRLKKTIIIDGLCQLLNLYANDKNSSTLREFITVSIAGYHHNPKKIGFNGERGSVKCEAKPRNIDTTSNRKHNGGGNFTDFTYERLERYKVENINIVVSGFVDGDLIFVLEFPFAYPNFYNRLKEQLDNKFHGHIRTGFFLRSANFGYKDYKDSPQLKLHYLNRELLKRYKEFFRKGFYQSLVTLGENKYGK